MFYGLGVLKVKKILVLIEINIWFELWALDKVIYLLYLLLL